MDILSTISGGSITGAAWCLSAKDYESFHVEMLTKLNTKNVIKYIVTSPTFISVAFFVLSLLGGYVWVTFTIYAPISFLLLFLLIVLLFKIQFRIFPVSKVIEEAYDNFFFNHKTLNDLKDVPLVAIGSSNLHTGRPFTFSKKKMSDSAYAYRSEYNPPIEFLQSKFPLARAVVASSCVPFAFSPVTIDKEFFKIKTDFDRIHPQLIDGGVYDNQGIHKISQSKSCYECDIIITSDAGGNFIADKTYPNTIALLIRTVDLFMYRIKSSQMVQNIYNNVNAKAKPIAYLSLGWKLENCIPGFINNMISGQVLKEILLTHNFKDDWINSPSDFRKDIHQHLANKVDYYTIKKRDLSEHEWKLIQRIGTSLKPLPGKTADYLIRHAENLTELQVKLYCPILIQ